MSANLCALAAAAVAAQTVLALPVPSRAETVNFTAQLASEGEAAANQPAPTGSAELSLDTATKTVRWTIEYAGLAQPPQAAGCGALDSPGGPAIWLNSNLASPITGSKTLSDDDIAALGGGRWVCVIGGDEAEIGGELKPAR